MLLTGGINVQFEVSDHINDVKKYNQMFQMLPFVDGP